MKKYLSLLLLVVLFASCDVRSPSQQKAEANTMEVLENSNTSPVIIEALGKVGASTAYSLKKDGVEYIIISKRFNDGGIAIIKHEPIERPTVTLNTSEGWLDEYSMLGYTKAEPSKESLESLTNPEVRPASVTI